MVKPPPIYTDLYATVFSTDTTVTKTMVFALPHWTIHALSFMGLKNHNFALWLHIWIIPDSSGTGSCNSCI